MRKEIILVLLVAVLFASGCTSTRQPIRELTIPGHEPDVYTFANDIEDSLKVPSNNPQGIWQIGNDFVVMNIVFNGANTTDNAYTRVVIFNLLSKLNVFYGHEGKYIAFNTFYYIEDNWYNTTGGVIPRPDFQHPVLWIVGPSEAEDTSVNLLGNTIYLSGTDYGNLTMAGDKLALTFFGIGEV